MDRRVETSQNGEGAGLKRALEAILFVSDEPRSASVLAQAVEEGRREVEATLTQMARDYESNRWGVVLRQVAGGWRLMTHPEAAPFVERFVVSARHARLTKAS